MGVDDVRVSLNFSGVDCLKGEDCQEEKAHSRYSVYVYVCCMCRCNAGSFEYGVSIFVLATVVQVHVHVYSTCMYIVHEHVQHSQA